MKQKSVGLTLRAFILALVLSLVAGSPALPPFDGVAYAQSSGLQASVAPDNSNVTLTWDAVTGADSYQIWRGEVVGGSAQWGTSAYDTVTAPAVTYTDDSVTAGATYAYAVRSVTDGTAASWTGPYPNVIIGGGIAAPTARPSVTVAAVGTTAVDVSWTSVSGATSYHIQFWHAALGNNWDRIPGDQTSPYSHTGLTTGTEYFYVVRAANAGGNGDWSNWRTDNSKVTLAAASAVPTLTLDHQSRNVVQLSWTASAGGSTYKLERRKINTTAGGASTPELATAGWDTLPSAGALTSTSYRDSAANYVPDNAGDAVKYEYRVRATDSNGITGDPSAVKSVTIPASGAILGAPLISPAAVSSSSIRVTWSAVPGAAFYQIHWKSGDGNYTTPTRVDGLAYEHLSLNPSTRFTYQVRAVNINGAGVWSAAKSATTLSVSAAAGQMPQVRGLTVTDDSADNALPPRTAKLTWTAVSGATHYDIQRYDPSSDAGWEALGDEDLPVVEVDGSTRIPAASSPSYEDEFDVDGGANGGTYFYAVSAVDDRSATALVNADTDNDDLGEWSDYKSCHILGLQAHCSHSSDGSADERWLDLGQLGAPGCWGYKWSRHVIHAPMVDRRELDREEDNPCDRNPCDRTYFVPPHKPDRQYDLLLPGASGELGRRVPIHY